MTKLLPLNEMTIEEKLQVMEQLWDDLSRNSGDLQSPSWHGDVLAERAAASARGEEIAESWDEARKKIEKDIR